MDSLRQQAWQRARAFVFSPLTAPGSAEGRDAIALACSDIAAGVTGRGRERLHRFRHLVALELLIPLFLSPEDADWMATRSEEHTSELQSLMRISYAVFCLKKKTNNNDQKYNKRRSHK